jgi:hypothetical protein
MSYNKECNVMTRLIYLVILIPVLLASLTACGLRERLAGVELPADWRDQGAVAATRAAEAVATAAVQAGEARELTGPAAATAAAAAATVAAQGGDSLATAQAAGLIPPVDIDFLKERVANMQPDGSGTISATFTDAELNQAIRLAQQIAIQTGQPILIHDAQIRFASGLITINGRVMQPTDASVSFIFRPYVSGNSLQFEVIQANLGDSSAPALLLAQAESLLNRTLGEIVSNLPTGFTLQDVIVGEGMITIVARR